MKKRELRTMVHEKQQKLRELTAELERATRRTMELEAECNKLANRLAATRRPGDDIAIRQVTIEFATGDRAVLSVRDEGGQVPGLGA